MSKKFKVMNPKPNVVMLPTVQPPLDATDERELLELKGTLDEIVNASMVIQNKCEDFIVKKGTTDRMLFEGNRVLSYFPEGNNLNNRSPISDHAMGQLCNRIGVPFGYIKNCEKNDMDELVTENINQWLDATGKDFFIREHDHRIRGVLSTRYSTLDTPDILDVLLNSTDFGTAKVKGHYLSPERFHLRLTEDTKLFNKDDLFPGIQIDSSDVGRSTLRVQFLIYKLVCTNGMVVPTKGSVFFEQKHIGITKDEFREGLIAATKQFGEAQKDIIPLIKAAKNKLIDINGFNDEDYVRHISSLTHLGTDQSQAVYELLNERYEPTMWGLANTLTEYAQSHTLERRLEIERTAGGLLFAA